MSTTTTDVSQWVKSRKKQLKECVFVNSAKYTPTDCFFGDFAQWDIIQQSYSLPRKNTCIIGLMDVIYFKRIHNIAGQMKMTFVNFLKLAFFKKDS